MGWALGLGLSCSGEMEELGFEAERVGSREFSSVYSNINRII